MKTTSLKNTNLLAWLSLLLVTFGSILVLFFGPSLHSEVGENTTLFDKISLILLVFLVTGAVLLPIGLAASNYKLNRIIFYLGSALLLFKLLNSVYNLIKNNNFGLGLIILGALIIVFSIFAFLKIKASQK